MSPNNDPPAADYQRGPLYSISDALARRRNNFDIIRLIAALAVLASHSFPLVGQNAREPFKRLFQFDTAGTVAVAVFFSISGFLVTKSVLSRDYSSYFLSRALRIVPALALVTLLEIFALGPVVTSLPLAQYFTSDLTWGRLQNISVFRLTLTLPGVFEGLTHPVVNGSLWTLPLEGLCYVLLPVLAVFGLLSRGWILSLLFIFAIAYVWSGHDFTKTGMQILLVNSVPAYEFSRFGLMFFLGSVMWIYQDRVPLSWGLAAGCFVLLYACSGKVSMPFAVSLTIPYLTLFFALHRVWRIQTQIKKIGDLSYGVYIFAFPIQNAVIWLLDGNVGPNLLTAISAPIVLCFALASYHLVEKPCIKLKEQLTNRPQKIFNNVTPIARHT